MARAFRWIAACALPVGAALAWGFFYRNQGWGWAPEPASPKAAAPASPASAIHERFLDGLEPARPERTIDTSAAASAVASFRAERLTIPPRTSPAEQIAVQGTRVGRLERDRLIVSEPGTSSASLSFPLPGAELVVPAAAGGLLAMGKDGLLLLNHREKAPRRFPRVTLFPGSMVLPDLIDTQRLWVRHLRAPVLYGYALEAEARGLLPLTAQFELAGVADGPFLALRDGSFIHLHGSDWQRFFPQGKRFDLRGTGHGAKPFRVLLARRIDQFFVLYEDARLDRVQIQERLQVVWSHQLDALPIDVVAAGNTLVLLNTERRGRTLGWWLEVIRPDKSKARLALGDSEPDSFRGDWVNNQLKPRGLAASEQWVAVGGLQGLRVWRLDDLSPVPVRGVTSHP